MIEGSDLQKICANYPTAGNHKIFFRRIVNLDHIDSTAIAIVVLAKNELVTEWRYRVEVT